MNGYDFRRSTRQAQITVCAHPPCLIDSGTFTA